MTSSTAVEPASTSPITPPRRRHARRLLLALTTLLLTVGLVGQTPPASAAGSMPRGDLSKWHQIFAEDYSESVSRGSYLSSWYNLKSFAYSGFDDTAGNGRYDPTRVLSTRDGVLDWYVHSAGGNHNVSAVVPRVPSTGWGQTYGRYSVRFRSDELPGYKIAFMLWPDSDNWGEGEVDFAEVNNLGPGSKIYSNLYRRGNKETGDPGSTTGFKSDTKVSGNGWHVATVEWSPNNLTYFIDGEKLGTTTSGVPNTSFHLVLQVETALGETPHNSVAGHLQVDWVTMYSYKP